VIKLKSGLKTALCRKLAEETDMKKKYQSEILQVIHQEAEALFAVGTIDEARMREYDRDCLVSTPKPGTPALQKTEIHSVTA
jgi:DNA-binding transcriptional regulator YiaG